MSLKNSKAILSLFLLFLIHTFVIAQSPTTPSNDTYISKELETQLLAIASEAITTQLLILVSGDLDGNLKNKKYVHLYRDAMMSKFKLQIFRRNKLKETRQDYRDFKTSLVIKMAAREGNKITLKITETTELKMDMPGGPPFYGYIDDHIFEFLYRGKEWVLVKESILTPEASPINTSEKLLPNSPPMVPLKDAPPNYRSGKAYTGDYVNSFRANTFFSHAALPSFNHGAAAEYASSYALTPNTAYATFSNDCTNFVSQCMYAGGWAMVGNGFDDHTNPAYWYYSCLSSLGKPRASYTWAGAYNFNVFILNAGRVEGIQYYTDLEPGDIIAADWDTTNGPHAPDGRVDHWMIVTTKDTDGNVYVSYHSNNRLNKPMTELRFIDEPGANFYGDRVK